MLFLDSIFVLLEYVGVLKERYLIGAQLIMKRVRAKR